ncbi:STE2 [Candida pseudojiufengensis]|uniref:STE2 n=1 Tax=Candida pseudojiufengensis TaxID=497109 RepID=UPI0022252D55|nr:STE2 [Candida pseudojiufengensis]KAI5962355.1 STE2 [Candida pseudojiufengensis]
MINKSNMDQEISQINSGAISITYTIPGVPNVQTVPFGELDKYHQAQMNNGIVLGVTIGASSMLLIVLLGILYKKFKTLKTSLLFNLNIGILLMIIFRSGCYINYLLNNLASISFNFTGVYNGESFASSDAANGFKVLLITLIQASLIYQIYVMFKNPTFKNWGILASILAGSLALASIATQIYSTIRSHLNFVAGTSGSPIRIDGILMDLPTILFSVSINIISILLTIKLGLAIKTRRYLGLKQFDSFHILFIMSTQTMVIPSIILFVHYFNYKHANTTLINVSLLLIVISLPLSSLWAQTANDVRKISSSPSMSFISRSSSNYSNNQDTLGSASSRISKFNTIASSSSTTPVTLKGGMDDADSFDLNRNSDSNPLGSTVNTGLPRDLEKYLNEDIDEGIIAREITILKD